MGILAVSAQQADALLDSFAGVLQGLKVFSKVALH